MPKTTFIKLPAHMQRPINSECSCPFCKANPRLIPMWDTLACGETGPAWTVHFPELNAVEVRD